MVDVIELGVQHHGVGQVDADGLKDCLRAGIVLLHQLLHSLQLLSGGQIGVQLDTGPGRQLDDSVLREVLAANADVGGPLVSHGLLVQVNGGESQLADPAQHILVLVNIAHSFAGAHGQAHDRAAAHAHSAGQSGDVAVIGNHHGDIADLGAGPVVDGLDLIPAGAGDLDEQTGDHGSIADENTGRGNADAVHPGHLGGRGAEGIQNTLELVLGIGLGLGMPDHFLGVNALAVDDSGDLTVGTAGIKADAAAVHVAADGTGGLVGSGAGAQGQIQDLQLALVELLEEVVIEEADTVSGVGLLQLLGDLGATADTDLKTADGPQQELDIAFHIAVVRISHFGSAVDIGVAHGNMTLVTLNSNGDGVLGALQISIGPNAEGDKIRVQRRNVLQIIAYA